MIEHFLGLKIPRQQCCAGSSSTLGTIEIIKKKRHEPGKARVVFLCNLPPVKMSVV